MVRKSAQGCCSLRPKQHTLRSGLLLQLYPQHGLLHRSLYYLHAARAEKAKAQFPRPVAGSLKPVVRGQTVKYNAKQRLGRGFTLEELKVGKWVLREPYQAPQQSFWQALEAALSLAAAFSGAGHSRSLQLSSTSY